jgi:hypothetical protein
MVEEEVMMYNFNAHEDVMMIIKNLIMEVLIIIMIIW